jgi:hypothetical protein
MRHVACVSGGAVLTEVWWGPLRERAHLQDPSLGGIIMGFLLQLDKTVYFDVFIYALYMFRTILVHHEFYFVWHVGLTKCAVVWRGIRYSVLYGRSFHSTARECCERDKNSDILLVNNTSQQDFVPRKVYCVPNVTFHAESKYAIKIFPSRTVFLQWHFLLLIFRNFSYFLQ